MKTTVQFLDAVRARHGLTSDYQLAKFLEVTHTTISNYRVGRSMMGEEMCLKIAVALGLGDPGEVLVAIAHEREKRPEVKRAWERVAKRLAASTAAVLVALGLAGSLHNPFRGATQPEADQTTHMRQNYLSPVCILRLRSRARAESSFSRRSSAIRASSRSPIRASADPSQNHPPANCGARSTASRYEAMDRTKRWVSR